MENFVKIKRPFKVADARVITHKGTAYAECLVTKDGCQVIAVATKSATQQLLDILNERNMATAFAETEKNGKALAIIDLGVVAWLTVNQYGHSISFIRKEK